MQKSKNPPEAQLLELLKRVLPKAAPDPKTANKIYDAIESELKAASRARAFEKFCDRVPLVDLKPASIDEVKTQLVASFGDGDVTLKPDRQENRLMVEVALPDGHQFSSAIKVNPEAAAENDEPEVKVSFVPFPVALAGDPELVWVLAKRENMTSEEAAIALARVQEEFWESKVGQKLQRDRVEKSFPEFIARVPAGMLSDAGLKRHYKTPEPIKVVKP